MVTIRRKRYRKRHVSTVRPAAPATAVAPTLVSAAFDENALTVTLTFDRAIDIAAIVPGAIVVDDGPGEATQYEGTGPATLAGPATVRVPLTPIDSSSSPVVLLQASAATGIVAAQGGMAWAGVTDQELPFP